MSNLVKLVKQNYLYIVFLVALSAVFSSLYFSEVQLLPPCPLCWYQRIFMYPLVIISGIGIYTKDSDNVAKYILGLSIPGLLIGFYHYLIQKTSFLPESTFCSTNSVSCSAIDWEILGFVTIPFLSLLAFALICIMCVIKIYSSKKNA